VFPEDGGTIDPVDVWMNHPLREPSRRRAGRGWFRLAEASRNRAFAAQAGEVGCSAVHGTVEAWPPCGPKLINDLPAPNSHERQRPPWTMEKEWAATGEVARGRIFVGRSARSCR
jgi:hypothetical protein